MLFQHTSTLLITLFHHLGANSSLFVRLTKMMLGVKTLQSTYFLFCFFRMPAIKKRAKTGRRNARLMIPKISYAQLPLEKQCQIVKVRNMLEAIKRWGICWKRCYIMNANIYLGFFLILSSFLAYSLPAKHWGDAKEAAKGDVKVGAKEVWFTLSFPLRILFRIPFYIPIAPLSQFLNKIGPSFTFFLLTWILPWWSSIYTTCLFPHFLSLVYSVVLSYCNACMLLHLLSYLRCIFKHRELLYDWPLPSLLSTTSLNTHIANGCALCFIEVSPKWMSYDVIKEIIEANSSGIRECANKASFKPDAKLEEGKNAKKKNMKKKNSLEYYVLPIFLNFHL